jgi:hypothetical protein
MMDFLVDHRVSWINH